MNKYLEKIGSALGAGVGAGLGAIIGATAGYSDLKRNKGESDEDFSKRKINSAIVGAGLLGTTWGITGHMLSGSRYKPHVAKPHVANNIETMSANVTKANHFSSKAFNHVNDAMAHKIALSKLPLTKMHEIEQEYMRTSGSKEPISHIRTVLRQANRDYAAHHRFLTGVNSHWSDYINSPEFSKLKGFNKSKQYLYKEARECQNY